MSVCPSVALRYCIYVNEQIVHNFFHLLVGAWPIFFQQSQTANPRRGISSPKHCHHLWSWTQNSTVGHRATVEMSLTFVDHSFIHSLTHQPTHPSIHPSIHSFIHSFIHSLICSEWQVQIRQCVTSVSSRHSRGKSPPPEILNPPGNFCSCKFLNVVPALLADTAVFFLGRW